MEKVEVVVQATPALAIEELKTKGKLIVPKFSKATKREAESKNKRKETTVVVLTSTGVKATPGIASLMGLRL